MNEDKNQASRPTSSGEAGRPGSVSANRAYARPQKPVQGVPKPLSQDPLPQELAPRRVSLDQGADRQQTGQVRPVQKPVYSEEAEKFQTQRLTPSGLDHGGTDQGNHEQVSRAQNRDGARPQAAKPAQTRPIPEKLVSDETRRQIPVNVPVSDETIKVSSDTEAASLRYKTAKNDAPAVVVSARNRNAADMDTIFRKEARMTEIPGSRSYPSFFYRLKRRGPAKQYRLKGYANKEYVKQRRKSQQRIQNRANTFFWVIIVILLLILFYWIDPIDKIQEITHLMGM